MPLTKNPYQIKSIQGRKWRGNHAARTGTRLPDEFVADSSNVTSKKIGQLQLRNGSEIITSVPDGLLLGTKHIETMLVVASGDKLFLCRWTYPPATYDKLLNIRRAPDLGPLV